MKICGVTGPEQARQIVAAGADALGINFWPKSKRFVPLDRAARWLPSLASETTLVAVMVNPEPQLLDRLIDESLVQVLQLHGDETPELIATLIERGAIVIKALQVRDESSLDEIGRYPTPYILLDAYNPGLYGGAGESFPWELATLARHRFPEKQVILSGGLTPENIHAAVSQTGCRAVDVASGVESTPGIKDLDRVRLFISEAKRPA